MRLNKPLLLTALLVASATAYVSTRLPDPQTRQTPAASVAPSADKTPATTKSSAGRTPLNPASIQSFRAPPAPRAATESLQTVLPQVAEIPADWREFQPEEITFEPYPGMPFKFTKTNVKEEGKYVTWIGRNPDLPGASLVGIGTESRYDAIMVIPGMPQFSLHVDPDGRAFVHEADPGAEGCGVDPIQLNRESMRVAASGTVYTPASVTNLGNTGIQSDTTALPSGAVNVDVIFLYDAKTLSTAQGSSSDAIGYIDSYSKATIESGNVVLGQSQVTSFRWRYLGSMAAPNFVQSDKLVDDLEAMVPGGSAYEAITSIRYQQGADQVFLWHGSQPTPDNAGGQAYARVQTVVRQEYAIAVARWSYSYKSVIHELAHNFGCQHDRANANVEDEANRAAPDGDGFYSYGQLWTNPSPIPNYPYPNTTSTIMGYGSSRIPYFSNPNITLELTSELAGWPRNVSYWGTQALGVAIGQPKAAYNAKVLQDNATAMSNMREEITVPQIIQQPASGSAFNGQTLSVSAQISGGGLTYQWSKDGTPISGATSATYLKSPASNSDAGTYSVKATNRLGSVTSNDAVITVTTPPPPPSTGGGGGGGGGGSPSLWFLAALSTLAATRYFKRRGV